LLRNLQLEFRAAPNEELNSPITWMVSPLHFDFVSSAAA